MATQTELISEFLYSRWQHAHLQLGKPVPVAFERKYVVVIGHTPLSFKIARRCVDTAADTFFMHVGLPKPPPLHELLNELLDLHRKEDSGLILWYTDMDDTWPSTTLLQSLNTNRKIDILVMVLEKRDDINTIRARKVYRAIKEAIPVHSYVVIAYPDKMPKNYGICKAELTDLKGLPKVEARLYALDDIVFEEEIP